MEFGLLRSYTRIFQQRLNTPFSELERTWIPIRPIRGCRVQMTLGASQLSTLILGFEINKFDSRWIWKLKVSERIRIFEWLVMQSALQVNLPRFQCNLGTSPSCPRCSAPEETILHCLRDCPH